MVDLTQEQLKYIIQALFSAYLDAKNFYYAGGISHLAKQNNKLIPIIIENYYYIESEIFINGSTLAEKIGINVPPERLIVIPLLGKVNLAKYSGNWNKFADEANQYFNKQGLKYFIPPEIVPEIESYVKAARKVTVAKLIMDFIKQMNSINSVIPYTNKYSRHSFPDLEKAHSEMKEAYHSMAENATYADKITKIGTDCLHKLGYPALATEGKDPEELAIAILKEMIAIESIMEFQKQYQQQRSIFNEKDIMANSAYSAVKRYNLVK